jgi:hypothetical protein
MLAFDLIKCIAGNTSRANRFFVKKSQKTHNSLKHFPPERRNKKNRTFPTVWVKHPNGIRETLIFDAYHTEPRGLEAWRNFIENVKVTSR